MVYQLKNNVAVFSAFKANHYASAMRSLMVDEDGKKRSWGDFRKEANKIDPKYNQLWLAAEYNLATRQARSAEQWNNFKRDQNVYPNLEYMPSRSAEPRQSHTQYYGIVKPIDDPFWSGFLPPNGWGCKCWVQQTRSEATQGVIETPPPPAGIAGNAGKSGQVFSPSHPFVSGVSKSDKKAVQAEFNKMRSELDDVIEFKIGKNAVHVPVTADGSDLLQNIKFGESVVKKFKKDIYINSHSPSGKNPEFTYNKTIGDMTTLSGSNTVNYIRNTFDKLKPNNQLGNTKKCFLAMDFNGKLTDKNYFESLRFLHGKMVSNPKLKFVILKNGDNIVQLTDKMNFNDKLTIIEKELLK